MRELLVLAAFVFSLVMAVSLNLPIIYPLAIGYVIFAGYAKFCGFSIAAIARMSVIGVRTIKNILILFVLIGFLTAMWRASGVIVTIVAYAAAFAVPSLMLLMTFLLNCLVSVLTGTAFGTVATMGVITMTMAVSYGFDPLPIGGAIVAGCFFGDRWSPVSTSALLVSAITQTDLYENLKNMAKTGLIPFAASCTLYWYFGKELAAEAGKNSALLGTNQTVSIAEFFAAHFRLGLPALLPAAILIAFVLCRIDVKKTLIASILTAFFTAWLYQGISPSGLFTAAIFGYHAVSPELSAMLDGGGLVSMLTPAAIITVSASFSGIFDATRLLDRIKRILDNLRRRTNDFSACLAAAVLTSLIACNQTLAILLTHQASNDKEDHAARQQLALDISDTVVVISALVPWSIAASVPLATVNAPPASLFWAFYLYLLPLWRLVNHK